MLHPHNPATWFNLANAQSRAGRTLDAADSLIRCLRLAPGFGPAHANLATHLLRLGLLDPARDFAATAVALLPDDAEALACQGGILHHGGEFARAADCYRRALRSAPDHAGILSSLGNTLDALGRMDEALALHDRAVGLGPADATCRFNRAVSLLTSGAYAEGWAEYEWRWRRPGHAPPIAAPPWRGEALEGRTILLHAEQGLGDTLQFVRYAPPVAARGARVLLEVQPPLVRLLRGLPGVAEVFARGDPRPRFDFHCPLLSLPRAFGTTLETIPATTPYLHPGPGAVARWRDRLATDDALLVGLAWAGAPHRDDAISMLLDRRRSLAPADLAALVYIPGVRFVSLQKDQSPPHIPGLGMLNPMADMKDFADTAGLVGALDLVISVDTSVAHLAAGMGCAVWLLSRADSCWRWLRDRADSPWYPSMTIYRQSRPGDWAEILARLRADLLTRTAAAVPPLAATRPTR